MTAPVAKRKRPLTLFQVRDLLRRATLSYDATSRRYLRCIRDSEPMRVIDEAKLDLDKAGNRLRYWRESLRIIDEKEKL